MAMCDQSSIYCSPRIDIDIGLFTINTLVIKYNKSHVGVFSLKTEDMDQSIDSSKAPKAVGAYPHARKVGQLLFLSGVGPRTAGSGPHDSGVPGLELDHNGNFKSFDFEAQVHSVFANVKAILESAGSDWEKLVDITVFLVDMKRDFHTFNRIYADYFPNNKPCRTTVAINSLPTPIAIELKCIAEL